MGTIRRSARDPERAVEVSRVVVRPPNAATLALAAVVGDVHELVPVVAGGNDMPWIEAAYEVGLTPIHTRSEAGAAFAANGIAWESGLPTLCIVITSVGVYGAIQALYAASVNRRPVVLLSGEVARAGSGSVQAGDGWDGPSVVDLTRPLTAWSFQVSVPELVERALRRAVALARERRMPVHLNVPLGVQKAALP
jgi:thiamine pyrophosphate-dependent acetolactate synthase large subunit-like protein